jgi:hypothetical protein
MAKKISTPVLDVIEAFIECADLIAPRDWKPVGDDPLGAIQLGDRFFAAFGRELRTMGMPVHGGGEHPEAYCYKGWLVSLAADIKEGGAFMFASPLRPAR